MANDNLKLVYFKNPGEKARERFPGAILVESSEGHFVVARIDTFINSEAGHLVGSKYEVEQLTSELSQVERAFALGFFANRDSSGYRTGNDLDWDALGFDAP